MSPRARRAAWALIVVGVLFRAWAVGHARFTGDESYFWATARNTAIFEAAPVYGPSMTGSEAYHPGPLFYYLLAVPQRLGASPWFGGLFVVLLHGLAAFLLYDLLRRAASERAGLAALLLWLFAPWDVLYGDRIWLSCVAPVWGAIILYAAARIERPAMQGVLLFFAATCPQLHMSAPVVWAAAAVLVLGAWPRWSWRALAIGLGLAVLSYAPPLYHELTHDFVNTRAILAHGGGKEGVDTLRLAPFRVFFYAALFGSSEIGYHFARGYWGGGFDDAARYLTLAGWRQTLAAPFGALNLASIALSVLAWLAASATALLAFARARSLRAIGLADRLVLALLAGLAAAVLLLVAAKKGFFPHYANLFMPMALVPLALLVDRARGLGRVVLAPVLLASVLSMGLSTARYYREVDGLNGLDVTLEMVDRVLWEVEPTTIRFTHFHNGFAWGLVAQVLHRRGLPPSGPAIEYTVHNDRVHADGVGGRVRLERRIR